MKANEQRLRAFAEEWLSEGAYSLTYGTLSAPAAGESGWLLQVHGWRVVPRGDWRTRMDDAVWFWPAQDSGWWIQNERNVYVAANGLNIYRPAIRAITIEDVEKSANLGGGRLTRWMSVVRALDLRSVSLDFTDHPPQRLLSARIQFQDSGPAGVLFKPLGAVSHGSRRDVEHLWGPWYYFRDIPASDPL